MIFVGLQFIFLLIEPMFFITIYVLKLRVSVYRKEQIDCVCNLFNTKAKMFALIWPRLSSQKLLHFFFVLASVT